MNKIKVVNNKIIPFVSDDVEINDNSINFNNNGKYFIDYIDCNNVLTLIIINVFIYLNILIIMILILILSII